MPCKMDYNVTWPKRKWSGWDTELISEDYVFIDLWLFYGLITPFANQIILLLSLWMLIRSPQCFVSIVYVYTPCWCAVGEMNIKHFWAHKEFAIPVHTLVSIYHMCVWKQVVLLLQELFNANRFFPWLWLSFAVMFYILSGKINWKSQSTAANVCDSGRNSSFFHVCVTSQSSPH